MPEDLQWLRKMLAEATTPREASVAASNLFMREIVQELDKHGIPFSAAAGIGLLALGVDCLFEHGAKAKEIHSKLDEIIQDYLNQKGKAN